MASAPYRTILSPAQWRMLQLQYRQALKGAFYRRHLVASKANQLKHIDDFHHLPVTTKADLVANNPDFLTIRPNLIREWVTTSGTTGQPVRIALSQKDLQRLAENEAAALRLAGLRSGDGLLIAVGMDRLFVAGLAYWLGAQMLGATCLRAGPSMVDAPCIAALPLAPSRRWFIIGVPSLLGAGLMEVNKHHPHIAGVIGIGESLYDADFNPNALARALQRCMDAPVLSTYASTETCSTFAQCPKCRGNHLNPRMAIVEILDDHGHHLPPGTPGRVVITPLGQHAMPLLRFDTGDAAALHAGACPCGRRTPRLGPILGRSAQLLKVQGVSIFATAIIELVCGVYRGMEVVVHADLDPLGADRAVIYVICPAHRQDMLKKRFDRAARAKLKCVPVIRYCDGPTVAQIRALRPSRKATVFVDTRA